MQKIISIIQLITATLLILVILFQGKGAGVSSLFGGSGTVFRTKRGIEKKLHLATIILSIIFLGLSLVNLLF
jgi:preprotein translocase subunit SecG